MLPEYSMGGSGRLRALSTVAASVAFALALPIGAAAPSTAADSAPAPGAGTHAYIVQLAESPVASYTGGVSGIPATRPKQGARIARTADVRDYRSHLGSRRTKAISTATVPTSRVRATFDTVFNGFAADLTEAEATRLRRTVGVARVYEDLPVRASTNHSPDLLGLTGSNGVWKQRFGGAPDAGNGTVIGVIDSGYWPENPSFAAMPEPRPDQAAIDAKWKGKCDVGTSGPITCNNKVIGARYYDSKGLAKGAGEFTSPRDALGHGTHTASTAAGLNGVPVTQEGQNFATVSGIAPGARLAIYKTLWALPKGGSEGATSDVVQAVEDAVKDGVDVISLSIGFGYTGLGASDIALYNAAAAGVFVSAAAGNAGWKPNTVENAWPWMTTVAASTTGFEASRTLRLGDGTSVTGGGVGAAAVATASIVDSAAAARPDTNAQTCEPGTLDPAAVAGAIVLCKFDYKAAAVSAGQEVKDAGGVGVVLYNVPSVDSIDAVRTVIPSVHLDRASSLKVQAYLSANPDGKGTIEPGTERTERAPEITYFSGAGPWNLGGGGLLKPDITAPGRNILAAMSPVVKSNGLSDFAHLSGTSMATPHISGLAALVRAQHPKWSPSIVRSALMTTATRTDSDNKPMQAWGQGEPVPGGFYATVKVPATPFNYGAGQVVPSRSMDPGLAYDSNATDWLKFSCGLGFPIATDPNKKPTDADKEKCKTVGSIAASDLNYPSISVPDVQGQRTVRRTVTNVGDSTATYTSSLTQPTGWRLSVSPKTLTVAPGESASFEVQVERTSAELNTYDFGSLTWTDSKDHQVQSPIVVRAKS